MRRPSQARISIGIGLLSLTAAVLWPAGADGGEDGFVVLKAVIAVVNGEPVRKREIEELASYYATNMVDAQRGETLTPEQRTQAASRALNTLVRSRLIRQEASRLELNVSDEELEAELEKRNLQDNEITRRELKDDLLFDKIMRKEGRPMLVPSPKTVRRFYEKHREAFRTPRLVRVRHISLPRTTEELYEIERRRAERIRRQATAQGASFAEIAAQHCPDPADRARGGLLVPPVPHRSDGMFPVEIAALDNFYPGPFVQAMRSLEPGEVSPVVESDHGFHILYVEDERPAREVPFRDAQARITFYLIDRSRVDRQREWLVDVLRRSHVTWHNGQPIPAEELMPEEPTFAPSRPEEQG